MRTLTLSKQAHHLTVTKPLTTLGLYLRALLRAPGRKQGSLSIPEQDLAPIDIEYSSVTLSPERIALFREVCGPSKDEVPMCFLESLFIHLMAEGVLCPHFPFSPFGLIHTRQRITQHEPVPPSSALDLLCRMAEIRETERGFEVDFTMDVHHEGTLAWHGVATLLSRNRATRSGKSRSKKKEGPPDDTGFETTTIEVPGDTGRRYAAASTDYNPHHLYPITARLFGYRRPIAHGMWTLAMAVTHIEKDHDLPSKPSLDVSFKKPILMPCEVELRVRRDDDGVTFDVRDPREGAPHLLGALR